MQQQQQQQQAHQKPHNRFSQQDLYVLSAAAASANIYTHVLHVSLFVCYSKTPEQRESTSQSFTKHQQSDQLEWTPCQGARLVCIHTVLVQDHMAHGRRPTPILSRSQTVQDKCI